MQTSAKAPAGSTPSWFTPLEWWLELEHKLLQEGAISRPFNFDPCGHREAPVSREILRRGGVVFTAKEDGLKRDWPTGAVAWVNPDYQSDAMDRWVPQTANYVLHRRIEAVGLFPAWTDREWWHDVIEPMRLDHELSVRFLRGRLRFGWPGNPWAVGGDGAKFPSALVVWPRRGHRRTMASLRFVHAP